jgi:hypothetical protein
MSAILQRRQNVSPGQVVGEVVNRDAMRVRQILEKKFAHCGKSQTVEDFLACIDGLDRPLKDVARAVVIAALREMGMQYPTWDALRADAKNVPYKVLLNYLGVPQASISATSTSAPRQGGTVYA